MRKRGVEWEAALPGWGLQDAKTKKPINPPAEISDQKIEMTDWELQDFAVQIVCQKIEKEGYELMSWQFNPGVDPSLWFVGNDGPEWVIVKTARYPQKDADLPANWRTVAENCSRMSKRGNFASVSVVSDDIDLTNLAGLMDGCVSSDIEFLVNKASRLALKDRLKIWDAQFETVLKQLSRVRQLTL
jgi:hypothetical protein